MTMPSIASMIVVLLGAFSAAQAPLKTPAQIAAPGPHVGLQKFETPHLTLTTASSAAVATPGTRFSLLIDVAPKPKMHVYAPGQKDYIPISITLEPDETLKRHDPVFPAGERLFLAPLNETQLVYSKPFRLVQDVTIALTPAIRQRASVADARLTIKGAVRYQACDDKVCYMPQTVPVSWTVGLKK